MAEKQLHFISRDYVGDVLARGDLVLQKFVHANRDPETVYVYSENLRRFYDFENSFLLVGDQKPPKFVDGEYKAYSYHDPEMVEVMKAEDTFITSDVDENDVPKFMVLPCHSYRILNTVQDMLQLIDESTSSHPSLSVEMTSEWIRVTAEYGRINLSVQQMIDSQVSRTDLEYLVLAMFVDAISVEPTHFASSIRW